MTKPIEIGTDPLKRPFGPFTLTLSTRTSSADRPLSLASTLSSTPPSWGQAASTQPTTFNCTPGQACLTRAFQSASSLATSPLSAISKAPWVDAGW